MAAMGLALIMLACTFLDAHAGADFQDAACEVPPSQEPASSPSLLQVQKQDGSHHEHAALLEERAARTCSYQLIGDQDGSQPCASLKGKKFISGRDATLDEAGYQEIAALCCHHEMSLFVRREIAQQGFDVCELSELHGLVHWYDCSNDKKTYEEMKKEIAVGMTRTCPWLGQLPNCPARDPIHCGVVADCPAMRVGDDLAKWSRGDGAVAELSAAGYADVAYRCCNSEMAKFIRREIEAENLRVCDEGGFSGFVPWFDCTSDDQSYEKLKEGLMIARSGLPPMCPWLGSVGQDCPPKGHNCPVVEVPEPAAHRRRTACR